ncbi:hypothetical protein SK128_021787 [Halocaridina rubra]|uniref:Down syndrome cell adhesion molecule-like protein Dscam2 n=1 Tax=Halocaridina rubra TaxID=373956 RepID=A0AAN8XHN5_HALRR
MSWEVNTTNLEKNLDTLPPATNISVRVKAFNDVAVRDVVGAGGSDATWKELTNLSPGVRVQLWVTATSVIGEGSPSPRLTVVPVPTHKYAPLAVGGGQVWQVGMGAGVTLGCRGIGTPLPVVSWTKGSTHHIINGQFTQLLPGGDLHLTGVRDSANYSCWVRNTEGTDSLTHQVIVITSPDPPKLTLSHSSQDTLNLTLTPTGDGGAPILGYTLHHRGRAGEWAEMNAEPGNANVVVRGLACGAPYHLYVTAWNSHGTSTPSPVLVANTQGKPPGRPEPGRLVEVNATCITLRLYMWPEMGCAITHWKVDLGNEDDSTLWQPLHGNVERDVSDLGICDLALASRHLLRLTAYSTAGETAVVYRVATGDSAGTSFTAESVQEVILGGSVGVGGWLDAHVVAGVVSALLLATALIICVCVAFRRKRYGGYSRQGESLDNKGGGEDDNARNCEITRTHLYSPTPTKKPRGSLASLKTQDDTTDPYEICPYATFSVGSSEATLEYGLSLHAMTPRDCLDYPTHSDGHHVLEAPVYGRTSRQRSQSNYKETEIAYITSNRDRGGDYVGHSKSLSCPQPTPAPTPNPGASDQKEWEDDTRKDSGCRPHRSRSRTREACRRDSSTESNDASSPVQQRQHYQHPQIIAPQSHLAQQQLPSTVSAVTGRNRPHPLPPVRLVRRPSESSSSDTSPMTPPRPLHPPSAFSDSRELSEAECDREIHQRQRKNVSEETDSFSGAGSIGKPPSRGSGSSGGDIKAELSALLQRYQDQQLQKLRKLPEKNPYSINV